MPADVHLQHPASSGLSVVSLLAGQLEGRLELDRGQGTRFKVTFSSGEPSDGKDW